MWKTKHSIRLSHKLKIGVGRGYPKTKLLKLGGTFCILLALTLLSYTIANWPDSAATQAAAPHVLGISDTRPEPGVTAPEFTTYKVRPGDTLFNISQRLKLHVPWTTLAEINDLKAPFSLKTGQVIKIPNTK